MTTETLPSGITSDASDTAIIAQNALFGMNFNLTKQNKKVFPGAFIPQTLFWETGEQVIIRMEVLGLLLCPCVCSLGLVLLKKVGFFFVFLCHYFASPLCEFVYVLFCGWCFAEVDEGSISLHCVPKVIIRFILSKAFAEVVM